MKSLKLLSEIALSFQSLNDFQKDMNKILELVGESMNLNRINIFLTNPKE